MVILCSKDQFLAPFYDQNGNGYYNLYMVIIQIIILLVTMIPHMEIKLYGGYLMIKEISIQKQKDRSYWIRNSLIAFGFTADNEINDMTFYNYKIINRSTLPLSDVYFGQISRFRILFR